MTTPSTIQMLKALGHLPKVELKDLATAHPYIDQASLDVLENRTCGHPDRPDVEIANSDLDELAQALDMPAEECECLQQMHLRMTQAATGTGSFPAGCLPEYPDNHAVQVFIERDSFPEHYKRPVTARELGQIVEAGVWGMSLEQVKDLFNGKPMLDVAVWLADETYRIVGCKHVQVDTGPSGQHHIHVRSVYLSGSTIGRAWFNNGRCSDHVNHEIDNSYRPGLMACARLLGHEYGHNHNREHEFNRQSWHHGVMSYDPPDSGLYYGYSTGEAPHVLPLDPSLPKLIRTYGGEPVGDPPVPRPPLPPKQVIVGRFTDQGREYLITRKVTTDDDDDDDNGGGVIWS